MTLLLADEFGMFNYWRVDMFSGAGDNSNDDSYIWNEYQYTYDV